MGIYVRTETDEERNGPSRPLSISLLFLGSFTSPEDFWAP